MIPGQDFQLWYFPVGIWLIGWLFFGIYGYVNKYKLNIPKENCYPIADFLFSAFWPVTLIFVIWLKWQLMKKGM
jgi:hypothetical protein